MAIFVLSDLHLSLGIKNKEMDIFGESWENHSAKILLNWNNLVGDNDTVVIGGDVSWAIGLDECREDFEFIENLNGKKIILKGNHDYWWNTAKKLEDYFNSCSFKTIRILHNNAYLVENVLVAGSRGWIIPNDDSENIKIFERECIRLKLSLDYGIKHFAGQYDKIAVFTHYPPASADNDKMLQIMRDYGASLCCCGHIHNGDEFISAELNKYGSKYGIPIYLTAADYLNFIPKKLF